MKNHPRFYRLQSKLISVKSIHQRHALAGVWETFWLYLGFAKPTNILVNVLIIEP